MATLIDTSYDSGVVISQITQSDVSSDGHVIYGQSFHAPSVGGQKLDHLDLSLRKVGNPIGTAIVRLRAHVGTVGNAFPGTVDLAVSNTINLSDISDTITAFTTFTFTGSNRLNMLADASYFYLIDLTPSNWSTSVPFSFVYFGYQSLSYAGNEVSRASNLQWLRSQTSDLIFDAYRVDTLYFTSNMPCYFRP